MYRAICSMATLKNAFIVTSVAVTVKRSHFVLHPLLLHDAVMSPPHVHVH